MTQGHRSRPSSAISFRTITMSPRPPCLGTYPRKRHGRRLRSTDGIARTSKPGCCSRTTTSIGAAPLVPIADRVLDADVNDVATPLFHARGHDPLTTRQVSRLEAPDDVQVLVATDLGRLLVAHARP